LATVLSQVTKHAWQDALETGLKRMVPILRPQMFATVLKEKQCALNYRSARFLVLLVILSAGGVLATSVLAQVIVIMPTTSLTRSTCAGLPLIQKMCSKGGLILTLKALTTLNTAQVGLEQPILLVISTLTLAVQMHQAKRHQMHQPRNHLLGPLLKAHIGPLRIGPLQNHIGALVATTMTMPVY
jgi:hypothetical protein